MTGLESRPAEAGDRLKPWRRFVGLAIPALVMSAFLPQFRLPGPPPIATTTTSLPPEDAQTFEFNAEEFRERWNSVVVGEASLDAIFDFAQYESADSTSALAEIVDPETGSLLVVTAFLDPISGLVRKVSLIASRAGSSDANTLATLLLISAVEGQSTIDPAIALLEQIVDVAGTGQADEPRYGELHSGHAMYRLAISEETQYQVEASA